MTVIFSLLVLILGAAPTMTAAQPAPESLVKKLAEFYGAERGQVIPVTDEALARAFPAHAFYVLRFPQYPVAMVPPNGLASNNVFLVKPDNSVELLRDAAALERFFRATLTPVGGEGEARGAARAWLRLAQEFRQDGFLRFEIPSDAVEVTSRGPTGFQVTGKALVTPQAGNSGAIAASLTFDSAGALEKVSETVSIKRGMRPICQATKLLDADPIVRGMAERDLLVMGTLAREYLAEQRAKAGPELQAAIDRIWRRILDAEQ